jgi:hypothetical protein
MIDEAENIALFGSGYAGLRGGMRPDAGTVSGRKHRQGETRETLGVRRGLQENGGGQPEK